MYEDNIKKYVETFKKENNEVPTKHQIEEAVKMFTIGPTGPRARLMELYSQLGYLLDKKPYPHSEYDISSLLEDMQVLSKWDIELKDKWWNVEINKTI